MTVVSFEELIAWQKAEELATETYVVSRQIRDFGFRDQLQRAVISVSNNIAEGFERRSNKEFLQFLYIAKGSCGEVRSMLSVGEKIGLIKTDDADGLKQLSLETSRLIGGLIKSLA